VPAMLLDAERRVVAANAAARDLFLMDLRRLPGSLVEITREAGLDQVLSAGRPAAEVRLVHHQLVVRTLLVPGPASGDTLMFITDVTQLRHLERVRQEFVANLSHELKTPVTSLRLAAESLQGEPPPATRHRFVRRLLKEADQLAAIVDNLRQLAEIEAGQAVLRTSRFDLRELVSEAAERVGLERPLELDLKGHMAVIADRPKLAQALGNLLDNAGKFSPAGAPVEVSAAVCGGELVVKIRDHGPGISPEHWDRVFERFYKVDQARSRRASGSGLGLAIVRHLVEAHGGRVTAESTPGAGTSVFMSFP